MSTNIPHLPQIAARPLQKPTYINRELSSYALWEADNRKALRKWYEDLRAVGFVDPVYFVDFDEFAACQFDREVMLSDLQDRQTYTDPRRQDEIDSDAAGQPMRGEI